MTIKAAKYGRAFLLCIFLISFIYGVKALPPCCTDTVVFSNLIRPMCGGNNGSVTASLASLCGDTAVNYNWSGGINLNHLHNLVAGTYSITITDNNSCTTAGSVTLADSGIIPALSLNITNASCGNNNGSLVASAIGTPPYDYEWSNGNNTSASHNLAPGPYQVTVTGNDGCSASVSTNVINIGNPPGVSLFSVNTSCNGSNGVASVTPVSGVPPFRFSWNTGDDTSTLHNIPAGTYTVTISDSVGCSTQLTINISNSGIGPSLHAFVNNTTCNQNNGGVGVNITAGPGPFTYLWNNSDTASAISSLPAGNYAVTVTGGNGCSASATAVVQPSVGVSVTAQSTNTNCGISNGTATVIGSGGTGSLSYNWNNGLHTSAISNLSSGTYTVTVTDSMGCTATATAVVSQSNGIGLVGISRSDSIICPSDSSYFCAPPGFTTYHWNTGANTQCMYARQAGNYYVTVTNAGNCSAESNHLSLSVFPSPPVSISVNGDTLTSNGGTSYQWYLNGQPIQGATSNMYVVTQTGHYALQVTNSNGCTAISLALLITVAGIDNINAPRVAVYPNPSHNSSWNLWVDDSWIGSTVQVFDAAGRLVYTGIIDAPASTIQFEAGKGIYLLHAASTNNTFSCKLIRL